MFKYDIEPHGGTEACKIKRNVPKPKFQKGGYAGSDIQEKMDRVS